MTPHATLGLFVWVLANQAGVPVPVAPWLLAVGALAHGGSLSLTVVLAITVGAALAADLVWYGLGRWRGAGFLDPLSLVLPLAGNVARKVGTTVNDRSMNLELFEEVEESILDLYSGTRNLYLQRRERAVRE